MIRPATLQDLPALLWLGERMHAESRYRVLRFSRDKLLSTLHMVLANPCGFLWVAESGGAVYGGLAAVAVPHWASDDLVAMDLALFVEPDARGGMAAARLVDEYRQWGRSVGAALVDIGVTTGVNTETTARLLESRGFTRCGVILES